MLADGAALSLEELQSFCEGGLARYKLPRRLVVMDELPRTATGKVAVGQLRSRYAQG